MNEFIAWARSAPGYVGIIVALIVSFIAIFILRPCKKCEEDSHHD